MSTWERLADLPLRIDGYALEGHVFEVPNFVRRTTTYRLRGAGEEGLGEDVVYDADDQERIQAAGPVHPLAGDWTLRTFSEHVATLELFGSSPPEMAAFHDYRTWALESAALDLALRQARTSLHEALGREIRPLTFVNSMRLGEPPDFDLVG